MSGTEIFFIEHSGIFIQSVIAILFVAITMVATHFIGPKRKAKAKLENFECGIESQGDARLPFSIKYFLTAILFVLFDVEIIFFYPWAVNFIHTDFFGFLKMLIFIAPLMFGFFYIVKKGGLKWE